MNNSVKGGGNAVGQMGLDASLNIHQFKYAAIMVTILPIICVYPFVQKYFVKGVIVIVPPSNFDRRPCLTEFSIIGCKIRAGTLKKAVSSIS